MIAMGKNFTRFSGGIQLLRLVLLTFLASLNCLQVVSQTTFSWRSEAPNANWDGASNWFNGTTFTNSTAGFGILFFNNSNQLTMTNNFSGTFSTHALRFNDNSVRTIGGNSVRLFDNGGTNPFIENNSTGTHVLNFNLEGDGDAGNPLQLNINNTGGFTFGGTYNNLGSTINVVGSRSASGSNVTFNGVISGTGGLYKENSNIVLNLTANNTYSGQTTIQGGTLRLSGSGSIPSSNVRLHSGGTLDIANSATVLSVAENGSGNSGVISISSGAVLTIAGGWTGSLFQSNITGSGGLTKQGMGDLSLFGTQSYTGTTTITGGTISSGVAMSTTNLTLNGGGFTTSVANIIPDNTPVTVTSGTYSLGGSDAIGSLAGAGGSVNLNSHTLTTGGDGTSTTYSGVISGTGSLTKTGAGTFTLSGANTYTGTTRITSGILRLGAEGRIANTSNMILDGGTFSTGATNGFTEQVGTLQLTANSTIALGTGTHSLTFANSAGVSWTGGTILIITGWTGTPGSAGTAGRIFVGAGGLTGAQLAQITFEGASIAGAQIIAGGELVPAAIPIISTLTASPNAGAALAAYNGSTITVTGSNFESTGMSISISNGGSVGAYTFVSSSEISFVLPVGASGAVTVTNSSGASLPSSTSLTNNGFISGSSGGNWSAGASWLGGTAPSAASDQVTIASGAPITLNTNATIARLTINSGATFTASDATARTLTISRSTSATTLTNNGTWASGSGGSTVVFTGAPSGSDAVHSTLGTIGFQNVTINKTSGSSNMGLTLGSGATVSGTLEVGSGGYIATPYQGTTFWGGNATLRFNTGGIYDIGSLDNTWPASTNLPPSIEIASGTVNLNSSRAATGNFTISGGTFVLGANLTINGNWTRSGGAFTPNNRKVTLSGTSPQTVSVSVSGGAAMYDLEVNNAAGVTFSSGGLTINDGGTLTLTAGVLSFSSALNLTVGSSASGTCTIVRNAGSLSFGTGGLVATAANIDLNYTNGADISTGPEFGTANTKIRNLSIAATSGRTVTLSNANTVNGNLTINSSTSLADGGFVVTVRGDVTNSGTLSGAGRLLLNATAANQTLTGGVFGNLEVAKGTGANNRLIINSSTVTINGNFTITSGGVNAGTHTNIILSGADNSIVTNGTLFGEFSNQTIQFTIAGNYTLSGTAFMDARRITINEGSSLDAGTAQLHCNNTGPFSGAPDVGVIINGTLKTARTQGLSGSNDATITTSFGTPTFGTSSTVEYNKADGGQTITALNYRSLTISNTSGTSTLSGNIGVAGTFTPSAGTVAGTSTVNFNNASGDQTIPAFNYNNLTVSNTSGTSSLSGNIGVAGTFTPSAGTVAGTSSVNFNNASGGQTIPSFNYNNLTVSNTSGTSTLSGNIGIAGAFTLSAGTAAGTSTVNFNNASGGQTIPAFNYNNLTVSNTSGTSSLSGNIGVAGTFTPSAGTVAGTSTVNFNNASGGQTIPAFNYNNLTVSNTSGTSSLSGNIGVAGTFTPSAGTAAGTSTVNFNNASGGQTIPGFNYNNLTLSNTSGTSTLSGNIGVAGNLSVNAGTLNLSTFTANRLTSGGTLTLASGAALQIGGTNGFPANYTTKTIAASSTIIYNGANQTADGSTEGIIYGNLELSGSGTKTFASNPTVAGNFSIGGTATVTAPASFTFNGTTDQSIAGLAYNNIQFSGAGTKTFTSNGSLGATSTMSFVSGSGAIDFDGTGNSVVFTLLSNATGTATVGNTNGTTLNGNVTVQRHFGTNKRAWRLVTAPVASTGSIFNNWQTPIDNSTGVLIWGPGGVPATNGLVSGPNASMRGWDNTSGAFVNVTDTRNTNLSSTTTPLGYFLFVTGPASTTDINAPFAAATVAARGTLLQGNDTFSISSPVANRFYLVPNPYASPVDQANLSFSSNITNPLWMWDPSLSGNFGVGGYVSFDRNAKIFNVETDGYKNNPYTLLQSGQAFFVQATAAPTGPLTVSFTEANKGGVSGNGAFRMSSNTPSEKMRVTLQRNFSGSYATTDGAVAFFYNNANAGVDDMDGTKLNNSADNLMFRRGTSSLTFEHRPPVQQLDTLFLNLSATSQTGYRLLLAGSDFTTGSQLGAWLQDAYLNTETALNLSGTTTYDFAVDANAASTGQRFRIVFRNNVVTPVRDLDGVRAFSIYPNPVQQGGQLSLEFRNRAAGKYTVTVLNLLGMQVQQGVVTHGGGTAVQTLRLNSGLAAGNYLLEITDDKGNRMQQKINIQ